MKGVGIDPTPSFFEATYLSGNPRRTQLSAVVSESSLFPTCQTWYCMSPSAGQTSLEGCPPDVMRLFGTVILRQGSPRL